MREGRERGSRKSASCSFRRGETTYLRLLPSRRTSKPLETHHSGAMRNSSRTSIPRSIVRRVLSNSCHLASRTTPTCRPFSVSRKSALSARSETRYSDLDVNMRSGRPPLGVSEGMLGKESEQRRTRFVDSLGDEIINEHANEPVRPRQYEFFLTERRSARVDAGQDALRSSFFIARRAVDLTREKKSLLCCKGAEKQGGESN